MVKYSVAAISIMILFGVFYTIETIILSFILASIGVTISLLFKKKSMGQEIAFGPYLLLGIGTMGIYGEAIMKFL